jgi:hypothetical protein
VVVGGAAAEVTVTVIGLEVEARLAVSPLYVAVTLWVPVLNVLMARVALPPVNCAEPSEAPPSIKLMVPVGVAVPDAGPTVAVNVTVWPAIAVIGEAARLVPVTVAVGCCDPPTCTVRTLEVDAVSAVSPI